MACCCWDLLGIVERYPELDEKAPMAEMVEGGGGQAATAMAAVAALAGNAGIFGRVGDDPNGRKIMQAFQDADIDTAGMTVVPSSTSQFAVCIILKSTGQRSIFWKNGTMGKPGPQDLDPALVARAKAVLIDSHALDAGIRCATLAREAGTPVVLDLEKPHERNPELASLSTHPIFPEGYGAQLTGAADPVAACRAVQAMGPKVAIVTLGERGCVALDGDEVHRVPAFRVPVVDTTGAGDVFHGAFTYGLALGMSLEENLRFASATAALACRGLGGRASLGTMEEVEDLLANGETLPTD